MNVKKIAWCAVSGAVVLAAAIAAPFALMQNAWRIPGALDMPEVTQVLAQLKDATVAPGFVAAAVMAVIAALLAYLLSRHKIISVLVTVVLLLTGAVCGVAAAEVNGVPVRVVIEIIVEYLRLGAF